MNELIADGISLNFGDRKLLNSIYIKIEEGNITDCGEEMAKGKPA